MKKLVSLICLIFIMAACNQSATLQSLAGGNEQAIIVSVSGDVVVIRADAAIKAEEGMLLFEHDLIKTGINGFAQVRFFNNATMSAGNQSTVGVTRANQNDIVTRVITGSAVFKVEKVLNEEFIVQTATNQFRVRGTEFLVRSNADQTILAILSGSVEAFSADGRQSLQLAEAGREVTFALNGLAVSSNELSVINRVMIENFNLPDPNFFGIYHNPEVAELHTSLNRLVGELDEAVAQSYTIQSELAQLTAMYNRERQMVANLQSELNVIRQTQAQLAALQQSVNEQHARNLILEQLLNNERALVDRYRIILEEQGIVLPGN
ncbi:MAG: FecR family protein [Spirochaetaceae bacterium]|nr:FecR family protein [Spirochaetaceae bacterium]